MKRMYVFVLLALLMAAGLPLQPTPARADPADAWWDEAWPYRIPVTVSGGGVAQVSIDFSAAFSTLGLPGALLDVRSLRLVPYQAGAPGTPIAYAESYSTMLEDADAPQIGWSGSGVFIYQDRVYLPVILRSN
jgi:hypothetical protein